MRSIDGEVKNHHFIYYKYPEFPSVAIFTVIWYNNLNPIAVRRENMKRKLKNITAYVLSFVCLLCLFTFSAPESKAANLNRENIFFFFKNNMGLNTAAAVGILANIEKESSFNPNATGDSGTSYGICQWHNTRWDNLKNYCAENGYDWTSLTGQLYYLHYELQKSYPNTFKLIKGVENNIQGAYDAAYYFCRHFEIPANAEANAKKRGELAQKTYWPIYGFAEGMKAPALKLNAEYTSVSSRKAFSFSWNKPKGTFDKYKLIIVRCVDETAGYDWDNMKQYSLSATTLKKSIAASTLPGGNYLAYITAVDSETGSRSDYSNFLYFSVYDELIYECPEIEDGTVYDAYTVNEITLDGYAISTGRYPVSVYWQIDEGEKTPATKTVRNDIAAEYPDFAASGEEIGYSINIPTAQISNGEHKLSLFVESKTINGLMKEYSFTVENSHEHSFTQYTSNKDATYSTDGTKTAKCDLCNTKNTIPEKGTKLKLGGATTLTATPGNKSVTLKWNKVKGATGYMIRSYNYSTKQWETVGYTNYLTYTVEGLSQGKKYYFAVKAYVDEGYERIISTKYKNIKTATKPAVAKNLKATQTASSVTITWNKVSGATGYRVYRYDTANKKWKIYIKSTTSRKITFTSLKKGTKYSFAVKPYIKTDSGIVWADSSTRIKTATKTATPTLKLTSTSKGTATATWTNVSGETGYQVYYSTKKSSGYKKLGTYKANKVKITKSGLTRGKTYYFKVRAYIKTDSGTVYSPYSSVKSIKIK